MNNTPMRPEKPLDAALQNRPYELPSANLAERIIDAAKPHQHTSTLPVFFFLQPYITRRIATAFCITLSLGFMAGLQIPDSTQSGYEEEYAYTEHFLYYDGELL